MQRHAGVAAGAVPERVVVGELAALGHLVGPRLDLLQAHDVRPVALQPVAELRLAGANAVDVPGGDLHRFSEGPCGRAALPHRRPATPARSESPVPDRTGAAQQVDLGGGLDAFGDHRQAQRVAEIDDRADDREIVVVVIDTVDQRLVDLQVVERKALQVGHRRVAGAEIVDGERNALIPQRRQDADRLAAAIHQRALDHFQRQPFRRRGAPRRAPVRPARGGRA